MIKKIIVAILLALPFSGIAQNYNPFVAQGVVSPAPLTPAAENGTGVISFLVGNTGDDPLNLVPNQEMLLVITLSRGIPNDADPIVAVGGTMATYFDWVYDAGTFSYLGTQNKLIPDALNGGVGTIEILYKVTSNSLETNPQNGFNVNLTPPAYTNGVNSLNDDQVSSYTWTETRIVTVQDMNATFVDSTVTGKVNTNDQVPVGTTYGTPSPKSSNPSPSNISMLTDGSYTFSASVPGVYVFDVPVCKPGQTSNCPTELLTITVTDVTLNNNPPTANIDQGTTYGQTPITINTLGNDACNNLNCVLAPGSVVVTIVPRNGQVTVDPITGNTTYTANAGFYGMDTLTYEVCDSTINPVKCVTSIQVINVLPLGGPNRINPVDDYRVIPMNTQAVGSVISNDSDPEGNSIQVTPQNITLAGKGNLVINSAGAYTFTPLNNYSGTVEFPYNACDNGSPQACSKATLYITISPNSIPLPIQVVQFTVIEDNCNVVLNWTTAKEENTWKFEIQRKDDPVTGFKKIAQLSAAGFSNNERKYSYRDVEVLNLTYEYRINVIDLDQTEYLTPERSVTIDCEEAGEITVYPNPASNALNVLIRNNDVDDYTVQLIDLSGRIVSSVYTPKMEQASLIVIPVEHVANGTYQIRVISSTMQQNIKVSISK